MTGESRRLELHQILKAILGSNQVYFQPKTDDKLSYPCIVYERDDASTIHANNQPYKIMRRYQVTYLDHLPNSDVIDKLERLPLCAFSTNFATSGLNHDVFVIYH